jgi:hypothetical protein
MNRWLLKLKDFWNVNTLVENLVIIGLWLYAGWLLYDWIVTYWLN